MNKDPHYSKIENMYLAAPINEFYKPTIHISEQMTEIEIDIEQKFFHGAGAVHGSVYFKMLDDAAYFAVLALEREFFILTTAFNTYLTRPVSSGIIRAVGKVVNQNKKQFIAESYAVDSEGREIARGSGIFMRSTWPLSDLPEL